MDSGVDVDEVLMEFLSALAKKAKLKRAEGVMAPKQEAAPAAAGEDEAGMAELEQMLADGGEAPSGETEMPCETCGKSPCEC